MGDREDKSLAAVGHSIYALLEQIAFLRPRQSGDSEAPILDLIINESDRFQIWSRSTGLLIPGHGSLDYRVREAESLSKTFHSFLCDLRENLEEVVTLCIQDVSAVQIDGGMDETDRNNNDDSDEGDIIDSILESIKDIVDRLFRLATQLRSPETRLRSSRAQKFQILDNGVDLFQCFGEFDYDFVSSVFRQYRQGSKSTSLTESVALRQSNSKLHVDEEGPQYLIERIALANVARRQQFAYWRHHRLKLDRHTEAAIAARKAPEPTNLAPVNLAIDHAPAMTISTATQLLSTAQDYDDLTSIASVSEYVPLLDAGHDYVVNFPPPPHVAADSKFFECPYCFTTCAKRTSKVKAWQAHLVHDLRPYVCTYEGCRTPGQLYDTKVDWIQHETTSHATTWICSVHPDEVFDGLVAFQLHVADGHAQNAMIKEHVPEAGVGVSANNGGRSCPICTVSDLPTAQLNDHIAAHLERMAVFSIPRHTDIHEPEDDGRDSDEANGDEGSRGLDMESDLSFESAPISSPEESLLPDDDDLPPSLPASDDTVQISPQQELERRKASFGSDHVPSHDAVNVFVQLGDIYRDQGEYVEAEQVYRVALKDLEKMYGKEHPDTLALMSKVGKTLLNQRNWAAAEAILRMAVDSQTRLLGAEHPNTVSSMFDLASSLDPLGRYDEAARIMRFVADVREKSLGEDHPDTLTCMISLARVREFSDRYPEAEVIYRAVLNIRARVLGSHHLDTLSSMLDLARSLECQDTYTEAENIVRFVLESREKLLGKDHPDTLNCMDDLARVLNSQGTYAEAEAMRRAVLDAKERILGSEHPRTLISMLALAENLADQGQDAEAEDILRTVVEARQRALGVDDVATQVSMNMLIAVLNKQGKNTEAERLQSSLTERENSPTRSASREAVSVADGATEPTL